MKAKTRQLPPNNNKSIKFVAPRYPLTMLQLAEEVNFPDLLSKEFEASANPYDHLVKLGKVLVSAADAETSAATPGERV